ncbi:ABC transporter permease [Kutzneria buriramensis]|uniref:Molybdenum transport system permease n=1 Tax=Kutzneria buriramensis TaxID=1045776 RepID=A0A3E0GX01_9PSEU|nr:ABC transporter permease [Kutzneria buriramensis]REH29400.1 molybdate transport system permease protein [Kutzneria buriramensis]
MRRSVPVLLWVPAALALALVVLPVIGLVTRSDLGRLPELVTSPAALDALWLSVRTGAAATVLSALLGGPLALVLARGRLPGLRLLRAIVLLPLVLPPVVGGLALLYLLGRNGFGGQVLALFDLRLPFTTAAVIIAQTFVAMPFLVIGLEGALRTAGERYEAVAATLGAAPWTVFRRVTVPLLLPALGSSLVLAFARALGEFGATITFAGNFEGTTQTLPLLVYEQSQADVDAAVAVSLLLVVLAIVVIAVARPRSIEGRL